MWPPCNAQGQRQTVAAHAIELVLLFGSFPVRPIRTSIQLAHIPHPPPHAQEATTAVNTSIVNAQFQAAASCACSPSSMTATAAAQAPILQHYSGMTRPSTPTHKQLENESPFLSDIDHCPSTPPTPPHLPAGHTLLLHFIQPTFAKRMRPSASVYLSWMSFVAASQLGSKRWHQWHQGA
jgi:hypothetical protein